MLAALALGVAILVTWLVSRSITRPLRSLTRQATAMADHRLPEAVLDILDTPLGEDVEVPEVDPVAVHTRDEVSDVADALNTVQDTALDLAVEQAVLRRNIADSFVNLGRRNQNLLGRQLDFITELETNETNPDTLSNLFRLDHLATRMRRNAESLLVLAGVEPPRKWAAPVRLTDVIRAALGEVEDYQRVTVRGVEPATIVGAAAADLAHLLAELIENALVFSPPDQTVDIRGRSRRPERPWERKACPDGRGRGRHVPRVGGADQVSGYTLAVIDSGLGMPPADIEAANRRLAGAESFTIAPSKYLGHYVAGNLAARHGIGVRLDASPGNGITATVNIPPALPHHRTGRGVRPRRPTTGREVPTAHREPAAPSRSASPHGGAGLGHLRPEAARRGRAIRAERRAPAGVTSSWPAPVGLSVGHRPPDPAPSRTQSGLVPRQPTAPGREPEPGRPAPPRRPPASPAPRGTCSPLSRHAANLRPGGRAAPDPPRPGPWAARTPCRRPTPEPPAAAGWPGPTTRTGPDPTAGEPPGAGADPAPEPTAPRARRRRRASARARRAVPRPAAPPGPASPGAPGPWPPPAPTPAPSTPTPPWAPLAPPPRRRRDSRPRPGGSGGAATSTRPVRLRPRPSRLADAGHAPERRQLRRRRVRLPRRLPGQCPSRPLGRRQRRRLTAHGVSPAW